MLELLFLLLPIAAAYGWYMGRRSTQQNEQKAATRLSQTYLTGVNFFLSNQKDKAVDLFLEMIKEEKESGSALEAHLTLGNLFRSRGEVARAIRIHQSLMESASLTYEQRLLAMQQLGRDYMAAGLYDRAEDIFRQLLDEADFRTSALQQLLSIYQATSEWQKAINIAEQLHKPDQSQPQTDVAHFYCEQALLLMSNDDPDKALVLLKKAKILSKKNPRVSIMLGRLFMEKQDYLKAIAHFESIIDQDKDYVFEILSMFKFCCQCLGDTEIWVRYLHRCVKEDTGAMAALYLAESLEEEVGAEKAQAFVMQQLQRRPTLPLFLRLIDFYLEGVEAGRAKESLAILRNMVDQQIRSKPCYRCNLCGFTAYRLYWQCPSCRSWSSIKPIRGLDGQ